METQEQTQATNSVAGYDEAEGVTYEQQEPQQVETATEANDTQTAEEPEIAIQDGEVKFRDDFFGDIADEPETNEAERQKEPEEPEKVEEKQTQEPSENYYTDDELQNTPYNQWDINRLPEGVRKYANFVREQMLMAQKHQQIQQQINSNPEVPPFVEEVKEYTTSELSKEAEELACERLGLEDADDFDPYESEHSAAREIAMRELLQKRNEQVAHYRQQVNEYQYLRQVNALIANQPDFGEYQKWFVEQARREGKTPEQMNDALAQFAKANHGGYKRIADVVTGWYQAFRQSKAQMQAQPSKRQPVTQPRQRPSKPNVLEGTQGGYQGKKTFNVKQFGELDSDQQAQALMDMGIV